MNLKTLYFCASLAAVLLSSSASAALLVPAESTQTEWSELPKPLKVVRFYGLPQRFNDRVVNVAMTIDESGVPRDISGWKPLPADLAQSVIPVLSQWKFSPARDAAGKPVALRVVLPIRLVGIP